MDLISHTLTGIAVGTVAATVSKEHWKTKMSIILIGGFGGALPDFDALSLWSKFDTTIGRFLHLPYTGNQIYFGKLWYSHHGAFHSILAPILLSIFLFLGIAFFHKYRSREVVRTHFTTNYLKYLAFILGFIFHLLEDMPTPASVWGGVNLFFPSSNYIGGFGKIWWWNNYDLVLIIVAVIVLNLGLNFIKNHSRNIRVLLSVATISLGIIIALYQINTRPIDFSYKGHTLDYDKFEKQSKEIQKEILGDKLYKIMEKIDNKIPLYF